MMENTLKKYMESKISEYVSKQGNILIEINYPKNKVTYEIKNGKQFTIDLVTILQWIKI